VTRKDSLRTCFFARIFFNYFHFPLFYKASSAGNLEFPIGKSAGNGAKVALNTILLREIGALTISRHAVASHRAMI